MARQIRLVLADDHVLFRDGLRRLLEEDPGIVVVGEASDGIEAVTVTLETDPDILLLDLTLPKRNGLDVMWDFDQHPDKVRHGIPPVILYASQLTPEEIVRAFNRGVCGVMDCNQLTREAVLVTAIYAVMRGEYWLNSEGANR